MKHYKKNQGPTILETIVVGIFKALWFLISLPFKKKAERRGISANDRAVILSKRQEIENWLQKGSEIELRHAVMEADKLVDHLLKSYGYSGETFADRLRSAEKSLDRDTYQSLWAGHKVRNQLAHEHNAYISTEELKRAVNNLLKYIRQV